MTEPAAAVAAPYDYERDERSIDRHVGFRPVRLEADLGRLHAWLNSDHVLPYWQLDDPLPVFRKKLAEKLADGHLTPYLGCLDHTPMSYWERYWAADDVIADYYDADPADQGIHLLIGPPEYLGEGYAEPLLRAMTAFQFRHPETRRVVTEPDVRNDVVIHVFEACGFEPVREISMDEKEALLMVCERERFERDVLAPERPNPAATGGEP